MTQSTEPKMSDAPITDTERLDVIAGIVAATSGGVAIHDATPNWFVVVEHDGVVEAAGPDLRAALDVMVRERRAIAHLLPPPSVHNDRP